MKCPKCGSENTSQGTVGYKFMCWDCDNTFLVTEKEIYQQRLDKVLAKFEFMGGIGFLVLSQSITLMYGKTTKRFVLNGLELSLDTVEHIIKDMEAQDDE